MRVFVIIVTFNAARWIDKSFGSLKNSPIPLNILAVDNNSSDNTAELLSSLYPEVELIRLKKNLGFGKANNIGIKKGLDNGADYIFLLNQDAWIDPKFIQGLVAVHKQNTNFGILSPIHLNGSGTALDYRFSLSCNETNCPGIISDLYLKNTKEVYKISFANAAFWLISKECILKAGIFDPIFPHYGEDTDYVNRIKYHGFKIGICPAFFGCHDRENREPSKKRDRAIIDLGILCNLKDINVPFYYSFTRYCFSLLTNTFKTFFRGDIISFSSDIKFFTKILMSAPEILKTRKTCKHMAAYL